MLIHRTSVDLATSSVPREREMREPSAASAEVLVPIVQRHALVVDFDLAAAAAIRQQLEDLGFAVTVANTGVEAVVACRAITPSVIFAAVQLRDVPGLELLAWLRSNAALRDVPIIAVHALNENARKLLEGGFAALVRKPIAPEQVKQAVRAVCKD